MNDIDGRVGGERTQKTAVMRERKVIITETPRTKPIWRGGWVGGWMDE